MKKLILIMTLMVMSSQLVANTNINSNLANTATISGSLSGLNNSSDLRVELYDANGNWVKRSSVNNGSYTFTGLNSGRYYVLGYSQETFWGRNYEGLPTLYGNQLCINPETPIYHCNNVTIGTPIQVSQGQNVNNINITLIAGSSISGLVKNEQDEPLISTLNIYKRNQSGSYKLYFSSSNSYDEDGNYTFHGLVPGSYKLKAKAYNHITEIYDNIICPSNSCQTTMGNTISISNFQTHRQGKNFSLAPIASVTFNFNELQDQGYLHIINAEHNYTVHTLNLSQGTDSITQFLNDGSYKFFFSFDDDSKHMSRYWGGNSCFVSNACDEDLASTTTISTGQYRNLNIQIDSKFELKLNVNSYSSIGNSRPKVSIFKNNDLISTYTQYSNPTSTFIPTTGNIKLKVDLAGYNSELYNNISCFENCQINQGSNINAQLGQSKTINMSLASRLKIRGRVRNANGDFIPNRYVYLYSIVGENLNYQAATHTDENGYYTFIGDLDTQAEYVTRANGDSNHHDTYNGGVVCDANCVIKDLNLLSITPNQTTAANINLKQKATLSIDRLTYFGGDIASNIRVSVYPINSNNSVSSKYTNSSGQILNWNMELQDFKLAFRYNNIYGVYPNIVCGSNLTVECLNQGQTVTGPAGQDIVLTDAVLHKLGSVHVATTFENQPISNMVVSAYNDQGIRVAYAYSDGSGIAKLNNLNATPHYLLAQSDSGFQYQTLLYPDISCPSGPETGCNLSDGTPISVALNEIRNINMDVSENPIINVNLRDQFTTDVVSSFDFKVYDESRSYIGTYYLNNNEQIYLEPGDYYFLVDSSWNHPVTWPNNRCNYNSLNSCDITTIKTIDNIAGQTIDFTTYRENGLYFELLDNRTQTPINGATVDIWQNQNLTNRVVLNDSGKGVSPVNLSINNDYQLSTDIGIDDFLFNEVYDNKQCPDGAVFSGLCNIQKGHIVNIQSSPDAPQIFQFLVDGDPIFQSTFE